MSIHGDVSHYVAVGTRFKTGERNPVSGVFRFDGYLDGTYTPYPSAAEGKIPLSAGEIFPPIATTKKGCYWLFIERA